MSKYKMPKCKICGTRFSVGAKFCKSCGSKIGESLKKNFRDKFTADMLFSSVFKFHNKEERRKLLLAGMSDSEVCETVTLENLQPWFYSRVFLFLFAIFAIFEICLYSFYNSNMLPGAMVIGSAVMPVTILLLYYELNVHRNISLYTSLVYFLLGGALSLLVTLALFSFVELKDSYDIGTAFLISIIEEIGKAVPIILLLNHQKNRRILNGLLIGGAIGCGFAVFESAGYAFNTYMKVHDFILSNNSVTNQNSALEAAWFNTNSNMNSTIILRSVLAFGGHVVWAAIIGAAYAREGNINRKFLKYFSIPFVLHAFWDWDILSGIWFVKYDILAIVAWIVIIHLINEALLVSENLERVEIRVEDIQLKLQKNMWRKRMFFKGFGCFLVLACVLFFSWAYEFDRADNLEKESSSLREKIDETYKLKADLDSSRNKIRELETQKEEKFFEKLSSYAVLVNIKDPYNMADKSIDLNGRYITYLVFETDVIKSSFVSESDIVYVQFVKPDGTLMNSLSSPVGYTYSCSIADIRKLGGWGSKNVGTYTEPGLYTIKVYYKDVLVGMKKVYIRVGW